PEICLLRVWSLRTLQEGMSKAEEQQKPWKLSWYVVPTGRVKVPAGRYVVPTGKDNIIVSAGRTNIIPAGSTILVLVVLCLLRVDSKVS
ncbi:hypothetical protein Tco_0718407, partial [Tanacetum coccineum]